MSSSQGSSIKAPDPAYASTAWALEAGQALSLPIGPGARELRVLDGRVWLTRQGRADRPAQDVWLQPGEAIILGSGERVVLEAWPRARFQLLVPPLACPEVWGRMQKAKRGLSPHPGALLANA
jgi:hypothetical protein